MNNEQQQLLGSLKKRWNAERTPSWLTTFSKTIIASYKQFNDDLITLKYAADSDDFHEKLMKLHFKLGDLWDQCWAAYKVDLESVRKHLLSCSENFDKLSEGYRDAAMVNCRENADIMLEQVKENYEQLSSELKNSTATRFVELSINLGQISPENSLLSEKLESIPVNDKDAFLQLIRCVQLLRLIIVLEEAELKLLHLPPSGKNANQATILAEARHLATTNKPSVAFEEAVPEPVIYGSAMGKITDLIRGEVRQHKTKLVQVKNKIQQMFNQKLGSTDHVLVEDEFKRECLSKCVEDISSSIQTLFQGIDEKVVISKFNSLESIASIDDIPLKAVDYAKTELKKLLTQTEERNVIEHFKDEFIEQTIAFCDSLKDEINFINCLGSFLSNFPNLNALFIKLEIDLVKVAIPPVKALLASIAGLENKENCTKLSALQDASKILQKQECLVLESNIAQIFNDFMAHFEIEKTHVDGRWVVEVLGKHILLSDVLSRVEQEFKDPLVEEVRIVCSHALHVDANLEKDVWHGKNIAVWAKLIKVHGPIVWDVSGEDNRNQCQQHASTDVVTEVGLPGEDGLPGESGGNVLIFVQQIDNVNGWTIISNGGNGSDGQDGGNGADGADGQGISTYELENDFKSPSKLASILSISRNERRDKIVGTIKERATLRRNLWDTGCCYIEAKTEKGNEIIFCYTQGLKVRFQCYLLYIGSPGEPGKAGGTGGEGGQGGLPGQIVVKNVQNHSTYGVHKQAISGADGIPGSGGIFGYQGKVGWDMGYLDYQFWSGIEYYGTDKNSKLKICHTDESTKHNVWCWKGEDYVGFATAKINHKQIKHEKRTEERRERQHHATMKKSIIESSFTSCYEQHFSTAERDALVDMFAQIEEMRQRALEASQQRKKQQETVSKQMKVQHLIASPQKLKEECGPSLTLPDVLDKKTVSVDFILRKLNPSQTDLKMWAKVNTVPLTYRELSGAYSSFCVLKHSINNLSVEELQTVERSFVNKLQLAAIGNKAKHLKLPSLDFVPDMSPMYTTSSLVEMLKDHVMPSFRIETLGTLKDCLDNYSYKQQRTNLLNYCLQDHTGSIRAFLEIFLQEVADYADDLPYAHQYIDEYNRFESRKQEELDAFFNNFLQDKLLPKYQTAFDMWRNFENHNESAKSRLERDINSNPVLNAIFKRFLYIKSKQFNFWSTINGVSTLDVYLHLVSKKGPTLRCYRELLARAFGLNIRVYIRSADGRLCLEDNHNASASEIINLLSTNGYFSQLYIDIDHLRLQEHRRNIIVEILQITNQIESIDQAEILDKMINKQIELPLQASVSTSNKGKISVDDATGQILSFFAPREQPIVKRWLGLISTLGTGYHEVIRSFLFRFANEGKHISTDELHFLVNRMISPTKDSTNMAHLYRWIVMAHQQKNWTREFILLQLENYFKRLLPEIPRWREYLKCLENKGILLLLSAKLDQCRPGNFVSTERMEETLHMLSLVKIRTANLLKLEMSEWFYTLEEIYCKQRLETMVDWEENIDEQINNDKLQETSYYAVALINQYSFDLTRQFFDILKRMVSQGGKTQKTDLVDIFCKIYNGKWSISKDELLSLGGCESVVQWKKSMESQFEGDSDRDISTLARLMTGGQSASKTILDILSPIETCIQNMQLNAPLPEFKAANENEKSICDVIRQLAGIDDVILKINGYRLRDTQKLAILTLLGNATNNTLVQVATGEGKSLIVVAVAIIKALRGEKVDIITSSSVLAKRDSIMHKKIYNHFKIDVSHNCNEDIDKRKDAYFKNPVIYGDLASFQRDYLLHNFYRNNLLGDRKLQNVIVDEVDSMLLDRGNNMLYLSHDLPDMDKLEAVYLFIWNWINKSVDFDNETIRHAVLWNIYGAIKLTDLDQVITVQDDMTRVAIWEALIEAEIINKKGYLITESVNRSDLVPKLGPELPVYVDRLIYFLNNCINREPSFYVPNYLRPFIERHLDSWIEAAKKAFCMQDGQDYVVDVDRSGGCDDRSPNIIILDRDTGTDMINSQWEAGLHQFIQLKHGCKTALQSLKAVFVSNVSYFTLYKHLYGLTGTLGSHQERDLLGEIYRVDFANIPTAKCKRFYEDLPVICNNSTDWKDAIYQSVSYIIEERKRSILIICETVNEVQNLYDTLKVRCSCTIRTYTRDFEQFDDGELPQQEVIIATNLAGRGTDIKITPGLRNAGGLHICLTYLPSNVRIEQQAFGRAARSGDRGSGQLIIINSKVTDTSSSRILHLKRERDENELKRISNIKEYYETQIKTEEGWFAKFAEDYKKLIIYLEGCERTKDNEQLRRVLLESCLDNWAYWLDEHCQNTTASDIQNELSGFLVKLRSLRCETISDMRAWTIDSPTQMTKLARSLLPQHWQVSIKAFNEIIQKEPRFCEAAHYYKACALSQNIDDKASVTYQDLASLEHELLSAAALLNERKLILTASVAVVDNSKTKDNNNITQINSYKEQKETICKFYDVLLTSINDILGHPVSPGAFINDSINETLSHDIYDALLRDELLMKPTIKGNVTERELEKMNYSFGLSPNKLFEFLQDYRTKKGESIEMSELLRSLKQTLKLPSKEGFWKTLRDQNVLENEIRYVIINKKKYEYLATKWKTLPQSGFLEGGIHCGKDELFLYPLLEQHENWWVFVKTQLKAAIGETVYKKCKDRGVFLYQKKALLPRRNKQTFFKQFDCITLEDFDSINICRDDAAYVLNLLVENNLLRKHINNEKVVYTLNNCASEIKNIELEAYKIYEKAVKDLLNFCFSYRTALETVLQHSESTEGCDIPLMMKPHQALVAELIANEIIQPVKVTENISDPQIERRLTSCLQQFELSDAVQSNSVGNSVDDLTKSVLDVLNILGGSTDAKTNCIVSVLKKLSGTRGPLKPMNAIAPNTDKADWYLFALNGLDMVIKPSDASWYQIAKSLLEGLAKISVGYCLRLVDVRKHDKSDEPINDGKMKLFDSLAMAGELILAEYHKVKSHHALVRLISLNSTYLVQLESRMLKFGQRVIGHFQSRAMAKYTRRITQSVAHRANIVQEINKNEPLVRNQLETLCTRLEDRLLKYIEQHEGFKFLVIFLLTNKTDSMGKDELNKMVKKALSKRENQEDFKRILHKMVSSHLQLIENGIYESKTNKTFSNIVFNSATGSDKAAFLKQEDLLKRYVQGLLRDIEGKFKFPAKVMKTQIVVHQHDYQNLSKLIIDAIRDNLSKELNEHLRKPLIEQASVPLIRYLEYLNQLKLGYDAHADPADEFAKHLRTQELRREMGGKSHAQTNAVESLLDFQFADELKKREKCAPGMTLLAMRIRQGKSIELAHLGTCLDAVRFVLLGRGIVISNITVKAIEDGLVEGNYSSPRNTYRMAAKLNLNDGHFRIGQIDSDTPNAEEDCLYHVLKKPIFELGKIPLKQFAIELSNYFVECNEKESLSNLAKRLGFKQNWHFGKVCFAQFIQGCMQHPEQALKIYNILLERSNANDWHDWQLRGVIVDGSQFWKRGTLKYSAFDELDKNAMVALEKAFLKLFTLG